MEKENIILSERVWLKPINKKMYSVVFKDENDFMMTMTGYDDNNFSKISWIRPSGYNNPLIVGESEIEGKVISKIIQDADANYIICV